MDGPAYEGEPYFSTASFGISNLQQIGYNRTIEPNDIWKINPNRSVEVLTAKLKASFKERVARGDKYPLLFALHETFMFEFWLGGLSQLVANILQVMSPFVLRYLIAFATSAYDAIANGTPPPAIGKGIGLVFGVTIMQVVQSFGTNHFIYHGMITGGQSRAVLISIIFEKAMTISGRARAGGKLIKENGETPDTLDKDIDEKDDSKDAENSGPKVCPEKSKGIAGDGTGWANGRVVNLMSVDTYRVDQASGMFHMIWTAPVAMIITLIILLIELTYSALAGFSLMIISLPILTQAVKVLFKKRKAINKITDQRVSLTQEILQAVRFVKYFGWESAFLERLDSIRNREIHAIQVLLAIRNAINAVSMSLPIFASMLSFITYSLTNHGLVASNVFSSLALFNSLRMPLNLLPLVIGQTVDAWGSLSRIQEYLLCEDHEEVSHWEPEGRYAIEIANASFTWERTATQPDGAVKAAGQIQSKEQIKEAKSVEKQALEEEKKLAKAEKKTEKSQDADQDTASTLVEDQQPFRLEDIDLKFDRNELVAIIGSVGSGKSSLLSALAGEMRKASGEIVMGAHRAYCPQYAWIQNATVRENITFGKEFNKSWYDNVVEACALTPDLEMLPNGDMTEIGERGITVSGGQKQRLNIARAIYFNADIILMDDPLSAVDAHVGRHIMDNAICGLLKDKCRILATHQLWVLNRCDRIIWLEEGKIQAVDTFDNLMANNAGFQVMMNTTAVEEERDEEGHVNEDEAEEEKKVIKKKKKGPGLMQAEERAVKSVSWSVYASYLRATGNIFNIVIVLTFLILSQGANIATSLWLSWWTSDQFGYNRGTYIGVYAGLGAVQALLMFSFSLSLTIFGTKASRVMLSKAITRALRAPMAFFDTTPLGRITNRFSRDVDVMDNNLTDAIRMYFLTLAMMTSVFSLIIAYFHYVSNSSFYKTCQTNIHSLLLPSARFSFCSCS